jgi:hypothetical protein
VGKSTGPFGEAEDGGGVGAFDWAADAGVVPFGWAADAGVAPFGWAADAGVSSAAWAQAEGLKPNPEPSTIGMTELPIRTEKLAVSQRTATARRGVEWDRMGQVQWSVVEGGS